MSHLCKSLTAKYSPQETLLSNGLAQVGQDFAPGLPGHLPRAKQSPAEPLSMDHAAGREDRAGTDPSC